MLDKDLTSSHFLMWLVFVINVSTKCMGHGSYLATISFWVWSDKVSVQAIEQIIAQFSFAVTVY